MQEKYDIVYSKTLDFVIYSCYGMEHLKYDCMRIAICLENMRIDWNVADYGIENNKKTKQWRNPQLGDDIKRIRTDIELFYIEHIKEKMFKFKLIV